MKLCIVGTGRSGTTLIWRMLNAHPDLYVHRETHWLPALVERFGTRTVPVRRLLDVIGRMRFADGTLVTSIDRESLPDHPPEMTVRDFCDLLGNTRAAAEGKIHWADKTPDYGFFIADIQRIWPEVRVLHLIRDGLDVARSMQGHIGYRALIHHGHLHWCPLGLDYTPPKDGFGARPSLEQTLDLWHDRLTRIRHAAEGLAPGSYLEMRHEEVMADPRAACGRIADFAGLSAPTPWRDAAAAMIAPGQGLARPRAPEQIAALAPHHRALMADLGYPVGMP